MEYSISNNNNNNTDCSETASAAISIAFYVIAVLSICVLAIISYKKDETAKETYHSMYDGVALFSFTTFIVIIADLKYNSLTSIDYHIYDMVMVIIIGCVYLVVGANKFFQLPPENPGPNDVKVIGYDNSTVSFLILVLTLILAIMEMFMVAGCFHVGSINSMTMSVLVLSGIIQKSLQAFIYYFYLKLRTPIQEKSINASWYFKIIALFNFSLWLESIVMAEKEGDSCLRTSIMHDKSGIFTAIYATFIIDYRLVCFFLFIEEALHIDYGQKTNENNEKDMKGKETDGEDKKEEKKILCQQDQQLKSKKLKYFYFGCVTGVSVFALQFLNIWPYSDQSKKWTTLFGILPDFGVLIGVCILLCKMNATFHCCTTNSKNDNNSNINDNGNNINSSNTSSSINNINSNINDNSINNKNESSNHITPHAVDILVILMGTIGILFWIFLGSITMTTAIYCDVNSTYFIMFGSKSVSRIFSLIFQIILFNRISDVKIITENKELNNKPWVDFALPLLALSFISVFANRVIENNSIGETRMHDTRITTVLYESGQPLFLGFCLHMSLHSILLTYYQFKNNKATAEEIEVDAIDLEDGQPIASSSRNNEQDDSIIEKRLFNKADEKITEKRVLLICDTIAPEC